jgi:hypothetical protein
MKLDLSQAFPAVVRIEGEQYYHDALAELRGEHASGVYAIIAKGSGRVLYVGESHTGRLYDTITRHFRAWTINPRRDSQGRRFGGTTYDRAKVRVAYTVTADDEAQDMQYAEIQRLNPADNVIDGSASIEATDIPV